MTELTPEQIADLAIARMEKVRDEGGELTLCEAIRVVRVESGEVVEEP